MIFFRSKSIFIPFFSVICGILVYTCFMTLVNCSVYNPLRSYTTLQSTPQFVYCVTSVEPNPEDVHNPQCRDCSSKPHINKD